MTNAAPHFLGTLMNQTQDDVDAFIAEFPDGFLKNAGERIKAFDLLFLHEIVRILGAINFGGRIN